MRFVIGRAGSGKTHFLHEQLVTHLQHDVLNQSAIWLAPKQATFSVERAIATDPRLRGFIHVKVIAPDDLGELALVETGSPAGARLDPVGRGLILGHLLRTHAGELQHFGRSATQPGLASEIDATFAEFEHAGQDLAGIDELIDRSANSPETSHQALARKLTDLRRLYVLYQQFLTTHGFDAYSRQALAPEAIEKCPSVQRSLVLIDDFYDFTAYERLLICAVAKTAKQTFISLLLDPDREAAANDASVFRRTETTYRQLRAELKKCGVTIDAPLVLKENHRFASDEIAAVERGFETSHKPVASRGDIALAIASDRADEVEQAARRIKSLLASGLRLREICVLARSMEDYEPLIASTFVEHDIPYFVDKRRTAEHHPLVRTLGAVAQIIQARWSHDAVCELAHSGLTPITPADADLLADYIAQHNIPPSAWTKDDPWMFHRPSQEDEQPAPSLFTEDEVRRVNEVRGMLRTALAPVTGPDWATTPRSVKERLLDLYKVLGALDVRSRMLRLIEDAQNKLRIEERDEHERVWSRTVELADQMVELIGEVPLTGAAFGALLLATLAELDLAITPPTLDQVLVGSIERTRTQEPKAVLLLGMNAGQFPRATNEKPILNDRDRAALQQSGIEVEPPSRQALLDERFLGYLALTRSGQRLILFRTGADASGNELEASPFWRIVQSCVSGIAIERPADSLEALATPRQLVAHTLDWARRQTGSIDPQDPDAGLYDWLVRSPTAAVGKVRDRAWPVLSYDNRPVLAPDLAQKLYNGKLDASVSRIESFAKCPFQHYARYALRLQEPADTDVTNMDLGNLYHGVLERLVRKAIEDRVDFAHATTLTPLQIRQIAQEVGEQLRNQVFLTTARNRYTLEQLESVVHKLIQAQQFVAASGTLRPSRAELVFGAKGDLPPLQLTTPAGNAVSLRGKIDRVDIDLERARFSVIDYKLRGDALVLGSVYHGLMLQLLTYLLVLESHGEKLAGKPITPAAALYVKLLRSIESIRDPNEAPDPETPDFHAKTKPRGLIDFGAATALDASLASSQESAALAIKTKKDGGLCANGNDAVLPEHFQALVAWVSDKIIALSDQIIAGEISVAPYVIAGDTPCATCPYLRVCRFDRLINGYRPLERLTRSEALARITGTDVEDDA